MRINTEPAATGEGFPLLRSSDVRYRHDVAGSGSGSKASSAGAISAAPHDLNAAANAYLDLSNLCSDLTGNWLIQEGYAAPYESMNLATDKPELRNAWEGALHEVTGILLSGVTQFADAAADLAMRAANFQQADAG